MDPNACIDFIVEAASEKDYVAARAAFVDLRAHLVGGGVMPTKAKLIQLIQALAPLADSAISQIPVMRLPPARPKTY